MGALIVKVLSGLALGSLSVSSCINLLSQVEPAWCHAGSFFVPTWSEFSPMVSHQAAKSDAFYPPKNWKTGRLGEGILAVSEFDPRMLQEKMELGLDAVQIQDVLDLDHVLMAALGLRILTPHARLLLSLHCLGPMPVKQAIFTTGLSYRSFYNILDKLLGLKIVRREQSTSDLRVQKLAITEITEWKSIQTPPMAGDKDLEHFPQPLYREEFQRR